MYDGGVWDYIRTLQPSKRNELEITDLNNRYLGIANCRPFLDLQLKVIHPRIIVRLGGVAAQNLLNTKDGVNRLRGSWYNYANAKVRVTFHPAYLLRNPQREATSLGGFRRYRRRVPEWKSS